MLKKIIIAISILFALITFTGCSEQNPSILIAKSFIENAKAGKIDSCKALLAADLKTMSKDQEHFEVDINLLQRLIQANGEPKDYQFVEPPQFDYISDVVKVNLGSRKGSPIKNFALYIYFVKGRTEQAYAYRIDRELE